MEKAINKLKKFKYDIVILVLLVLMYINSSISWINEWLNVDSFYSYGIFMPFFVYFYYKVNRNKLNEVSKSCSKIGFPVLIIGLLLYIVGIRIDYPTLVNCSLPINLAGIILLLWGYEVFSICILPLIVLIISLPILPIIRITTPLQLFFSNSTVLFLSFLGVKAHAIGSTVYMNGYAVSVAPGCTGLKSLLNLTALSFMYSYFINSSLLKKFYFVAASFPIAFINNMLRISLSGFYVMFNGYSGFETFHYILGLIFYATGVATIVLISKVIED